MPCMGALTELFLFSIQLFHFFILFSTIFSCRRAQFQFLETFFMLSVHVGRGGKIMCFVYSMYFMCRKSLETVLKENGNINTEK